MIKKLIELCKNKTLSPKENRRLTGVVFFGTAVLVFSIFIFRFIYIVGVGKVGETSLGTQTQEIYQGSSVVQAKRGTIYDRNGLVIAEDATSYSLYAILDKNYLGIMDPETKEREKLYVEPKNKKSIAKILSKYTDLEEKDILERLKPKKNKQGNLITQVEFKGRNISLETKNKIEKAFEKKDIKGIYFTEHPARLYPNGVFSPYLIGYANLADKEDESKGLTGQMGIEYAFNKELKGQNGKIRYQKDRQQNPLPGSVIVEKEAVDGKDIYTTLDSGLQSRLEDLMTETYDTYGPEDITATLMEAKTGKILAASQRPGFNPETLEGLVDVDTPQWQNLLVEMPFEPGSTMKPFTVAAAIELGVFNENATFETGGIRVGDALINDHMPEGIGTITYRQALAWSSNVGMVHLQQAMDMRWLDYIKQFGFVKTTNSGLRGENVGTLQDETTVDRAMSAYGQAISVTPFQMLQAYTAITNEGEMIKPRFIDKVVDTDGKAKRQKKEIVGKPIKKDTANKVLEMMIDITEDERYGTGKNFYKIDGYHVAAKTGTAQIFDNNTGSYLENQYLYSVVQVAPAEDPEYIMYVTLRRPPVGVQAEELISNISNPLLKRALDFDAKNQKKSAAQDRKDEEAQEIAEAKAREAKKQSDK